MQAGNSKSVSYLILGLSIIGMWSVVSHYMPVPELTSIDAFYPPPGKEWFLQQLPRYDAYPITTALHVIPACLFILMVPVPLSSWLRKKNIKFHRWLGRTFVVLCLSIIFTGFTIGIIMPFGGNIEMIASFIIGTGCLISLIIGVIRIRQKRIAEHRKWMLRMLVFAFAPVTMRGVMTFGVIMFDYKASDIFGQTLLIGMAVNLLVVECWIRYTTQKKDSSSTLAAATAQ